MEDLEELIQEFLNIRRFAVVGASNASHKYGHQVLAAYLQHGLEAIPVHPTETEIEVSGHGAVPAYPSLSDIPEPTRAVSIITPPKITERVVEEAAKTGAEILWMQPGAESSEAVARAEELGLKVIHGGPCVLVSLRLVH